MATTKTTGKRATKTAAGVLHYIDPKTGTLADAAADGFGRLHRIEATVDGAALDTAAVHVRHLESGATVYVTEGNIILRPDGDEGRQVAIPWHVLRRLTRADWKRIGVRQTHDGRDGE